MKKAGALLIFITLINFSLTAQEAYGILPISGEDLHQTISILSSKEFDGRLPGSEGYNLAANFVAEKFSEFNLKPVQNKNYFQYFNIEYNRIDTPAVLNYVNNDSIKKYTHGKDFVYRGFTGSNNFKLPVVFCGYGLSRPDIGYDDYANVDVKDKIVLVFKQNPPWKIDNKDWGSEYPREKSLTAKKYGAAGILFVTLPNVEKPQPLIGSVMHGPGKQPKDFPQLQISIDVANELISGTGFSISECQDKIDWKKKPFSFNTQIKAELVANAFYEASAQTMNIIGILQGNDPKLKEEYIIIGAHLDHVGSQAGLLFPGANDNASGSAAVLEIARKLTQSNYIPKRSIIFVLFSGEEQGLLGSKHFVDKSPVALNKIVAMLNLDCIGYGDSIQIGNGKSSPELWNVAKRINDNHFNLMINNTWAGGGADATPFHEKEIPALYFVSKYSYDHLHLPSDTSETINEDLIEKIANLALLTAIEIADGRYTKEKILK